MSAVATIHCPAKPNTERPAIGWTSIGRDDILRTHHDLVDNKQLSAVLEQRT